MIGSHMFGVGGARVGRVYRWSGPLAGAVSIADAEVFQGRLIPSPWRVGPDVVGEVPGTAVAQDGDFDADGFADALMTGAHGARLAFGAPQPAE